MTDATRAAASGVFLVMAFLWPWDVYQHLPDFGLPATSVLGYGLVAFLVVDAAATRQFRVPFELLWPTVLLLILTVFSRGHGAVGGSWGHVTALLVYAATVHFARSRRHIEQWLWVSCTAGAGAALWTLLVLATQGQPTAYSLTSDAALAFAGDLPGGALTLTLCFFLALPFVRRLREPGPARASVRGRPDSWKGLAALAVCGVLAGTLAALVHQPPYAGRLAGWRPPAFEGLPGVTVAALLVLLWLVCRVAAKVYGAGEPRTDATSMARALALGCLVAALFCVYFPVRPTTAHAFLLGLASAYALSEKESRRPMGQASVRGRTLEAGRLETTRPLARSTDTAAGWDAGGWTALVERDGVWSSTLCLPGGGAVAEARFTAEDGLSWRPVAVSRPAADGRIGGSAPDLPALRVYVPVKTR